MYRYVLICTYYVYMYGKNGERAMITGIISNVGNKCNSFYHEHMYVIH